jgi:CheY-like chemotaxis protein
MNYQKDTPPRKRILLVEDERIVREMVKLLLSQDGFTVVEANNGAEALGLFVQGQFDLVMTDFEMPFVKGNELALKIRQLAPRQPIVMMTGYRHAPGPGNPVDAIIDKPFDYDMLREVMAQALSKAEEYPPVPADDPGLAN